MRRDHTERDTDNYYIFLCVKRDWFPEDDKRNKNQATLSSKKKRIVALDPGVRKFMHCYSPNGQSALFSQDSHRILASKMLEITVFIESIEGEVESKENKRTYQSGFINCYHTEYNKNTKHYS